jgi:hypothetical protein
VQFPAITVCNTNVLSYGALRSNVTVGLWALDGVARDANGDIDLRVTPVHLFVPWGFSCVHCSSNRSKQALFAHEWFAFARHTRSWPSLWLTCITTPPLQESPSVREPNPFRSSRCYRSVEFWYPGRAGDALWAEPLDLH